MRDDTDRLRAGSLPNDPFADAIPLDEPVLVGDDRDAAYKPFPVTALPEPVRSFVAEASNAIGCDPSYVALPALAGLTAAIGNTRRIMLKPSWCEPAVIWAALVGESGTRKSPALDVALAPLRRLQAEAIAKYLVEKESYDRELERHRLVTRPGRQRGPEEFSEAPEKPVAWRITCSDTTVEALANLLQDAPRGLLLERDELSGWIRGFDQYKRAQGADAAHYLSMHRAGNLLIDRKSDHENIYIPRAAVSIVGGIQPRILKRVLGEEHLDNGLAARLLLTMPPRQPKLWTDEGISLSTSAGFADLYGSLLELGFKVTGDDGKDPVDLPLTPSGREAWIRFYNRHAIRQTQLDGNLAAAFSKLEGYCARFALIIHLIRCLSSDRTLETREAIDAASIQAGVSLTMWFSYETERVYSALGMAPGATSSPSLEEIIRSKGGRISVRELMRASRRYRDSTEVARAALDDFVRAGQGRWVPAGPGEAGRRSEVVELIETPGDSGDGDRIPPRELGRPS